MTIEALRQKPIGVLESRNFTLTNNGLEYEEQYYLVKGENGKYFVGFSEDGSCWSNPICEADMLELINNPNCSDSEAIDIYMMTPQLSCWIDN